MHFPGLCRSGSGSWVLHKGTDSVGSAFCALPRSKQLRWPGTWRVHSPQLCGASHPLPCPSLLVPGCTVGALSQVCCVSPLGSWSLVVTLPVDVNYPGFQEDLVSNWEPACNLIEDAISGAEIAPFQALAVTHLPPSLRQGIGWPAAG